MHAFFTSCEKRSKSHTSDFGIAENEFYCYNVLVQPLGKHVRSISQRKKIRSKANEIKFLRADPEQGIRALLYRILVKLQ